MKRIVQENRRRRSILSRSNRTKWTILAMTCIVGAWFCEVGRINDWMEENTQFRRRQSAISMEDIWKKKFSKESSHVLRNKSDRKKARHIMHTFFHEIPKSERITGMSDKADADLLRIWEESWQALGWETRVLTLEDAKAHPDFEKWEKHLEDVWLGKKPQYDQMCYYRWLAMSITGGGWMSDYDLMPLLGASSENIQMNKRFTVHDQTLQGDAIPSLLSGSQQEWERMARLLLENANKHKGDDSVSWVDMRALIEIYGKEKDEIHPYEMIDEVVIGHLIIPKKDKKFDESQCSQIRKLKGVHVCHHAMKSLGFSPEDRPRIAREFMKQWKEVCHDDNIMTSIKK